MPWTEICQILTNHPMLDQKNAMHNSSTQKQNTNIHKIQTQGALARILSKLEKSPDAADDWRLDHKDTTLLKMFPLLKSLLFRFGIWVGGWESAVLKFRFQRLNEPLED